MRSSSNSNYNSYENLHQIGGGAGSQNNGITMLQNLSRQSQILSRASIQSAGSNSDGVGQCQNMIQSMKNKISFLKERLNPALTTANGGGPGDNSQLSNSSHTHSRNVLSSSSTNINLQSQSSQHTQRASSQLGYESNPLQTQPTFGAFNNGFANTHSSNKLVTSSINGALIDKLQQQQSSMKYGSQINNAGNGTTSSGTFQNLRQSIQSQVMHQPQQQHPSLLDLSDNTDIISKLNKDYQAMEQRYLEQVQTNHDLKQMLLKKNEGNGQQHGIDGETLLLQQQVRSLEERLEESHRQQHRLENVLEEYEVNLNRIEENLKQNNKKFHDIQKKYSLSEQQKKELADKLRKIESEKNKLSEKWVKLSAKNKQEERQRSKIRELETQNDYTSKEISNLSEKLEKLERENLMLRKTSEGSNDLQHKHLTQIRKLNDQINDMQQEKLMADKVTTELLQRVKKYEDDIHSLQAKLRDQQNRSNTSNQNQESILREISMKENIIWKKEEMIEELKKDSERINQMLISKDMENQNLKINLNALQNEMLSLQSELEILNQYAAMKSDAHNGRFSTQQIALAYSSLQELLNTQFTPNDSNTQEIEIDDIQSLNNTNVTLIYDSEIQFTLLRAEHKLRRIGQYLQNPPPMQQPIQLENFTSPVTRNSRHDQQYQTQQQQIPQHQQQYQNDQNILNRKLKISNLIIQNHAGVQENNKIININTNQVICNKENHDMNNIASSRRQMIPPQLHTQSLDNFTQAFSHEPPRTVKNSNGIPKNNFQRVDSISKVLGPQKITNTPNALFQQNFQAFKQKNSLSNTQQLNQALFNQVEKLGGKNNSLRFSGQGSLSYRSSSKDQQNNHSQQFTNSQVGSNYNSNYGQRKNSCKQ